MYKKERKEKKGGQEGMMQCWIVGKTYWPKTDPFAPFCIHWRTRTIKETK